jgi:integrase
MPRDRKTLRGEGGVYLRGAVWWIRYSRNGKVFRESAETTDEKKAWKFLQKRLEEIKKPEFDGPAEKKLTLDDLEKKIEADYLRHGRRSFATVKNCLKPVKEFFPFDTLLQITPPRIEAYQQHRLDQGWQRTTPNREVRYLLHGYRLLFDAGEISYVPRVKLLEGENVREGFINRPEFDALCDHIDSDDTRDLVRFLYLTAWRSGEAMSLTFDKVDTDDWVIWLSRKNDKGKRPRTLALVGELREIIERRKAKRLPFCKYVFHRNGEQMKSFRKAFKAAAIKVGLGQLIEDGKGKEKYVGVVPHDMRRSGIRNFTKAGLGESEGMSISGHRTNSVYKRYNIIDEDMQRAALEKVQEYQKRELEKRKVVPIKKAG